MSQKCKVMVFDADNRYLLELLKKAVISREKEVEIKQPTEKLTERETEVLKMVIKGNSNPEIAEKLFISVHTAKAHVCSIIQKFGVKDRVQAAVFALRTGLVK